MPIIKSKITPITINGKTIEGSESTIVTDLSYKTYGDKIIICRKPNNIAGHIRIFLDHDTTHNTKIKAMTDTLIIADDKLIDEEYEEVELKKGSSIELSFIGGSWYILSSDGIKT